MSAKNRTRSWYDRKRGPLCRDLKRQALEQIPHTQVGGALPYGATLRSIENLHLTVTAISRYFEPSVPRSGFLDP
jgi:hypothetical protein